MKLFEISQDYIRAIEHAFTDEGDLSQNIAELKDSFETKCYAVGKYIKNLEAEHEAIKNAANAMAARAKAVENKVKNLTEYLRFHLEASGLADPLKFIEFDIKLQQNPPAVVIYNAGIIPDMYKKIKEEISIDKKAIMQSIKDGFSVEGARLESIKRLVIK